MVNFYLQKHRWATKIIHKYGPCCAEQRASQSRRPESEQWRQSRAVTLDAVLVDTHAQAVCLWTDLQWRRALAFLVECRIISLYHYIIIIINFVPMQCHSQLLTRQAVFLLWLMVGSVLLSAPGIHRGLRPRERKQAEGREVWPWASLFCWHKPHDKLQ